MTMRIAILAACAGTLALAQADIARANDGARFLAATTGRFAHEIEKVQIAEAALVVLGAGAIAAEAKKPNAGTGQPNKKVGTTRGTFPKGKARRGSKIADNENPRPTDRIGVFRPSNGGAGSRTYFIGGTTGGVWRR